MSTDHELLEDAAKAAGIEHEGEAGSWLAGRDNPALLLAGTETVWNPLRDDGDALRLAVKLGIKIELHPAWVYARAVVRGLEYLQIEEGWAQGGDRYAATRRAIVRAAASMAPQEKAPPCRGTACGTTTGEHSAECVAEHLKGLFREGEKP